MPLETVAVLPLKTFARAKQRLAGALSAAERRTLAEAMAADVLAALAQVAALEAVLVITGDARARRLARAVGAVVVHDPEEAGQPAAARRGVAEALRRGAGRALLVPGDCPLLHPGEITRLLERPEPVVVVPDRHATGTNGLLLAPPDALVPAFGPGSFARHAEAAGDRFTPVDVPSLALDVDTGDDLDALRAVLAADPGAAPRTRAVLAPVPAASRRD